LPFAPVNRLALQRHGPIQRSQRTQTPQVLPKRFRTQTPQVLPKRFHRQRGKAWNVPRNARTLALAGVSPDGASRTRTGDLLGAIWKTAAAGYCPASRICLSSTTSASASVAVCCPLLSSRASTALPRIEPYAPAPAQAASAADGRPARAGHRASAWPSGRADQWVAISSR